MARNHRNRRTRLFEEQGGKCFWCTRKCILPPLIPTPNRKIPLNEATLDHLHEKWTPERKQANTVHHAICVMACVKCNSSRSTPAALEREKKARSNRRTAKRAARRRRANLAKAAVRWYNAIHGRDDYQICVEGPFSVSIPEQGKPSQAG